METEVNTIRWVLGGLAVAFGGYVVGIQLGAVLAYGLACLQKRQYNLRSFAPLLGPLCVLLGVWIFPVTFFHRYVWLAWILDPATYVLILGLPNIIRAILWDR